MGKYSLDHLKHWFKFGPIFFTIRLNQLAKFYHGLSTPHPSLSYCLFLNE